MATKFNGFVNSKTLSEALTSSATDGKLYFPTDSDAIVENGKMHGGGRLLSHSWSGFVRSSNSASGSDFVLFKVVPLDTTRCWTVKFELNGYYNSSYQQQHIIEITGFGGSTPNIHATTFNNSTSPADTSVFNQLITYTKVADAYVGIGTSNVVSYSSSRTVRITLLDYSNCSVTLNDAPANTDYSTYANGRTRTACNIYAKGETTYNGFTIGSLGISNNYLQTSGSYLAASSVSVGSADKLDGYHATGLLENLSNSGNNISIKVGGTTKTLTPAYATSASKLSTARTINGVSFDGSQNVTGAFTSGLYEANLQWGGKNFNKSYGPIDAAMVPELGANRFAFGKVAGITIEYSRDAGATWTDYVSSDKYKIALFSYHGYSHYVIGKSSESQVADANCLLRVTLKFPDFGLYTTLNKFVIYCSTSGSSGCWCTIDGSTKANPTTFVTFANKVNIDGWGGYNVINTSEITTYSNHTSQYETLRFTFGCTSHTSTQYVGLGILDIFGYGGVGWSTPSNMANTGHLYSYDASQSATFPAQLTATSLIKSGGTSSQFLKADGSVDSNSYAPKATTLSGYGITDGVNTVTTSGSGNAVTTASVSGHTLTLTKGTTFLTSHQDISGKSNTSHTHSVKINGVTKTIAASGGTAVDLGTYLTSHQDLSAYAKTTDVDTKLATKAASSHTHDDRYFTETEVTNKLSDKLSKGRMVDITASSTEVGVTPFNVHAFKSAGYPLYTDPEFGSGNNSVNIYNNAANGTVTITRGKATDFGLNDSGNATGYVLKINCTGTASPGYGGFYQSISSRANAIFVQIFRAKVPTGYILGTASNSMGTSYTDRFLTSVLGTGKWEWYARIYHCGATGTFSTGGHVYIYRNGTDVAEPTTSSPLVWYLSYCNCIDITTGNYDGLRTRYSDSATKATQDGSGNVITSTYAKTSHTHTSSQVTGLATVATSGKYSDLTGTPTIDSALSSTSTNAVQNKAINTALAGKVDLTASGVSTAINKLGVGTATPVDADYYVCQYASGGTTTTSYHRRPLSSLWNWIKSKLATVATSGSYSDLKNKPTIPVVDSIISATSTNAIQNKTVYSAFNELSFVYDLNCTGYTLPCSEEDNSDLYDEVTSAINDGKIIRVICTPTDESGPIIFQAINITNGTYDGCPSLTIDAGLDGSENYWTIYKSI